MDMLFLTFAAAAIALGVFALLTIDDEREREPMEYEGDDE